MSDYLRLCRLHRPIDLFLLLLPALWLAALAPAEVAYGPLLLLLLAASAMRCAAWLYNDLCEADSLGARRLLAGLLTFAGVVLLLVDVGLLPWGLVALGLLLGYPHIKRRTLLTQLYLGLCFAWMVAMTQALLPALAAKTVWLLFTATLLWATAFSLLYAMPRRAEDERAGIGSLLYLFGDNSAIAVLILQLTVVIALWFVGRQVGLGAHFGLALLAALAQLGYQQWLLARRPEEGAARAYRSNLLFGLIILGGMVA